MAFVGKKFVAGRWRRVYVDKYGYFCYIRGRKRRLY